jgi:ATP-dependent protease ClpP protease subunit
MVDTAERARARAILDAAALLGDQADASPPEGGNTVVVDYKPPRIELKPRMDTNIASAPPSSDVLDKWKAGVRAESSSDGNVIEIYDIIGYDYWSGGGITAQTISAKLKEFGGADVEVHINSPGGDMFEGIAIYNVLQQYAGKVTVKVMALAASAASVIAMAGAERQIGQGAFFMIHNAWIIVIGNRLDLRSYADYLEPFDNAMRDVYAAVTKQKASAIEKWMDNETYFSATQAIEYGFATGTLDSGITEDKSATEKAKALNSVRKVENLLTKQGGMSRSAARSLIQELKGGKRDAAADEPGDTPGAVTTTKPGAGQDWLDKLRALNASFKG